MYHLSFSFSLSLSFSFSSLLSRWLAERPTVSGPRGARLILRRGEARSHGQEEEQEEEEEEENEQQQGVIQKKVIIIRNFPSFVVVATVVNPLLQLYKKITSHQVASKGGDRSNLHALAVSSRGARARR